MTVPAMAHAPGASSSSSTHGALSPSLSPTQQQQLPVDTFEILADTSPGPFEGPEKLLEVWFAPSADELPEASRSTAAARHQPPGPTRPPRRSTAAAAAVRRASVVNGAAGAGAGPGSDESSSSLVTAGGAGGAGAGEGSSAARGAWRGLRTVPREVWEDMLKVVKCQVLSVIEGDQVDAYLLSESSLFVAPHFVILKTCGTTINLHGLTRIIQIAKAWCNLDSVHRCFYSRKSFFFPERQVGPHRDWKDEVDFLDRVFERRGSAYTVGPMNGDHWLLYLTTPSASSGGGEAAAAAGSSSTIERPLTLPAPFTSPQDSTLEILMTHLSPKARAPFFHPEEIDPSYATHAAAAASSSSSAVARSGHYLGQVLTQHLGIDRLFPAEETTIDSFGFEPCGYSANAIIGTGSNHVPTAAGGPGGGYFTIHVTPEEGWSFASFESNVPLPLSPRDAALRGVSGAGHGSRPDLATLVNRVIDIFEPGRLSITLFLSTEDDLADDDDEQVAANASVKPVNMSVEDTATRRAWAGLSKGLLGDRYARKDRIGYEFEGYDLVFACFEHKGFKEKSVVGQRGKEA